MASCSDIAGRGFDIWISTPVTWRVDVDAPSRTCCKMDNKRFLQITLEIPQLANKIESRTMSVMPTGDNPSVSGDDGGGASGGGVPGGGVPGGGVVGGGGDGAADWTNVETAVGALSTTAFDVISHVSTWVGVDVDNSVAAEDASLNEGKDIVATTTMLPEVTVTDTESAVGKCARMSAMKLSSSNVSTVPASANVATVAGTYAAPGCAGEGGSGGSDGTGGGNGGVFGEGGGECGSGGDGGGGSGSGGGGRGEGGGGMSGDGGGDDGAGGGGDDGGGDDGAGGGGGDGCGGGGSAGDGGGGCAGPSTTCKMCGAVALPTTSLTAKR